MPYLTTPNITQVQPDETTKLSTLLKGSDLSPITANGFTVAGQQYAFTRGEVDDDDGGASFVQGRCKEDGKSSQGIIIYCTSTAIIVGVHDPAYSDGASFGKVNTDIGRVADYMYVCLRRF